MGPLRAGKIWEQLSHVSASLLRPLLPSLHSPWSSDVYAWPCSSSPRSPSLHHSDILAAISVTLVVSVAASL